MKKLEFIALLALVVLGCGPSKTDYELPVLGRQQIVERIEDGKVYYDTLPHTIKNFAFRDQDSTLITNETFKGKVYVADFFFTTCPTICPKMKKEMLRVYEAYQDNDQVALLSHTIDPTYDTVALLRQYAGRLGVSSDTWHFVTGNKDDIYEIGENSYMVTAGEDANEPGGFIHSGAFLLVDQQRRVRGVYDGTVSEQVDILMKDIEKLLKKS